MEAKQEVKINPVKTDNKVISFSEQGNFNQIYIDDLINIKKAITAAPTFIPKKFIDQIQLAHIGSDYKLYLYIDNSWKSITLS